MDISVYAFILIISLAAAVELYFSFVDIHTVKIAVPITENMNITEEQLKELYLFVSRGGKCELHLINISADEQAAAECEAFARSCPDVFLHGFE